jgi:asparagine synthase (glutamine-hydrolysing)
MCGIAGFTRLNGHTADGLPKRIVESLYHRGPDQQGILEGSGATLCAVRLKIIDLSGGDQPFLSDDGDTAIAFNGEIYNHLELRRELETLGHRFHSQCDTETVLHAFLEWDTRCFARMRGMFAAALWTESQKRLVLARDRMGIKPLYYYRAGQDVYFGSELKAILEHPDVPRRLNLAALDLYLSVNYVPGPETLIEGIRKVEPGHLLEWRQGRTRTEAWASAAAEWAPRAPQGVPRRISLGAAKEELDWLLREAVREHMVSDVPLGVWASGGLDSSTILCYAAAACSGRLKTFSVSFAGRSFDESPYFREVARVFGTDHHEFDLNPDVELRAAIEDFAYYSDEPTADAGALPVWYLSRMSRRHVTVALSGEGADELFGGYLTYMADRLARPFRLVPGGLRRLMRGALDRYMPVSDEKISLEYKLKRWIEGSWLDPDEAHFFWNGTFSNEQRREICRGAGGHGLRELVARLGIQGRGVERYLRVDQSYYLADDILCKTDRMSMAHSLEVRPPFLDPRIVDFAATLPARLKIRGFQQKFLLRELMRDKLPEVVLQRKKTGFDIPAHGWFRGVLRGLLTDTLRPEAVEATGIFDARAIQTLIRDHMERRINAGYHLWGLLTLFLWMNRWKVEIVPPPETARQAPFGSLATNS